MKTSSIAVILLGTIACCLPVVRSQANHTLICTRRDDGRERNVANCQEFIECRSGQATINRCAPGQLYNHISEQCELSNQRLQQQCFACPKNSSFIDLPVDFQPHQFVRCFRGRAEQRVCSEDLLFDPTTRTCNFEKRVVSSCPSVDRPNRPVFIRDRDNCAL